MERQNFEDSWKKAFEKAEIEPSGNVWTNIELDLERANGGKLKKKLVFFQLLAAAAVIFSLGLGAGVFIMNNLYEESANQLRAQQNILRDGTVATPKAGTPDVEPMTSADNSDKLTAAQNSLGGSTSSVTATKSSKTIRSAVSGSDIQAPDLRTVNATVIVVEENDKSLAVADAAHLPKLVNDQKIELHVAAQKEVEADPVQLMLAKLELRELEVREANKSSLKERSIKDEKLWTSVGFAAGSYNKMNGGYDQKIPDQSIFYQTSSSGSALRQANSIIEKEAKASGVAYSVGANLGTKISERWVLQGGVNYLTQFSAYTLQEALEVPDQSMTFRPPSVKEIDRISASDAEEVNLVNTPPYNVNNSLRYLSIPVQAGFLIVNRNLGLQLNAGVSTDLFLQNTVSAEGGDLAETNDGIGDKSSYRSFNLSGLAGTELSYRFSKNYRIALNPGIRYPFNSIYRSDAVVSSTPFTFDIGVRFRYIFH